MMGKTVTPDPTEGPGTQPTTGQTDGVTEIKVAEKEANHSPPILPPGSSEECGSSYQTSCTEGLIESLSMKTEAAVISEEKSESGVPVVNRVDSKEMITDGDTSKPETDPVSGSDLLLSDQTSDVKLTLVQGADDLSSVNATIPQAGESVTPQVTAGDSTVDTEECPVMDHVDTKPISSLDTQDVVTADMDTQGVITLDTDNTTTVIALDTENMPAVACEAPLATESEDISEVNASSGVALEAADVCTSDAALPPVTDAASVISPCSQEAETEAVVIGDTDNLTGTEAENLAVDKNRLSGSDNVKDPAFDEEILPTVSSDTISAGDNLTASSEHGEQSISEPTERASQNIDIEVDKLHTFDQVVDPPFDDVSAVNNKVEKVENIDVTDERAEPEEGTDPTETVCSSSASATHDQMSGVCGDSAVCDSPSQPSSVSDQTVTKPEQSADQLTSTKVEITEHMRASPIPAEESSDDPASTTAITDTNVVTSEPDITDVREAVTAQVNYEHLSIEDIHALNQVDSNLGQCDSSSVCTDKDSTPEQGTGRQTRMKRRSELDLLNDVDGSVSRRKKSYLFQKAFELYGEKGLLDNSLAKTLARPGKFDAENASRTQLIEKSLMDGGTTSNADSNIKITTRGKQNRFSHLFKKKKRGSRPQSPVSATAPKDLVSSSTPVSLVPAVVTDFQECETPDDTQLATPKVLKQKSIKTPKTHLAGSQTKAKRGPKKQSPKVVHSTQPDSELMAAIAKPAKPVKVTPGRNVNLPKPAKGVKAKLTESTEAVSIQNDVPIITGSVPVMKVMKSKPKKVSAGKKSKDVLMGPKSTKSRTTSSVGKSSVNYYKVFGSIGDMVKYCKPCSVKLVDLIKCLDALKEKKSEKKKQNVGDTVATQDSDIKPKVQKRKASEMKGSPPHPHEKDSPPLKRAAPDKPSYEGAFLDFLQSSPPAKERDTKPDVQGPMESKPEIKSVVQEPTPAEPSSVDADCESTQLTKSILPDSNIVPVVRRSQRPTMRTLYRCLFCRYTGHIRKIMEDHVYNHMDVIPYMCGLCYAIFGTRGGVLVHNRRSHQGHQPVIIKKSEVDETQYYTTVEDFVKKYGDVDSALPEHYLSKPAPGSSEATKGKIERASKKSDKAEECPSTIPLSNSGIGPAISSAPETSKKSTKETLKSTSPTSASRTKTTSQNTRPPRRLPSDRQVPIQRPPLLPKGAIPVPVMGFGVPVSTSSQSQMSHSILLQLPDSQGLGISGGAPVFLVAQTTTSAPILQPAIGTQPQQSIPMIQLHSTPAVSTLPGQCETVPPQQQIDAIVPVSTQGGTVSPPNSTSAINVNTEDKGDTLPPKRSPIILRIPKIHQWKKDYDESTDDDMSAEESEPDQSHRQSSVTRSLESEPDQSHRQSSVTRSLESDQGQSHRQSSVARSLESAISDAEQAQATEVDTEAQEAVAVTEEDGEHSNASPEADNTSDRSESPMLKIVNVCSLAPVEDQTTEASEDALTMIKTSSEDTKATAMEMLENLNSLICPTEMGDDIEADEVWQCKFCEENTRLYDVMVCHIQTVHKKTYWYACPYCPFGCSQPRFNMYRHMRRTHPNKQDNIFIGIIDADKYFMKRKIGPDMAGTLESKTPVIETSYSQQSYGQYPCRTDKSETQKVSKPLKPSTSPASLKQSDTDRIHVAKDMHSVSEEERVVGVYPQKKTSKPTAHVAPAIQSKPPSIRSEVMTQNWTESPRGATVPVYVSENQASTERDVTQQLEETRSQDELSLECDEGDELCRVDSVEEEETDGLQSEHSVQAQPHDQPISMVVSKESVSLPIPMKQAVSSPIKATVSPSVMAGQSPTRQAASSESLSTTSLMTNSSSIEGSVPIVHVPLSQQAGVNVTQGCKGSLPSLIPMGIVEASQVTGRKRTEVPPLRRAPTSLTQIPPPAHQGSPHLGPTSLHSITTASTHVDSSYTFSSTVTHRPVNTTLPIRGGSVRNNRPVSAVSGTRPVPNLSEEEEARRAFSVFNISARMRNPMRPHGVHAHRPNVSVPHPHSINVPKVSAPPLRTAPAKVTVTHPDLQQFKQFQLPPRSWNHGGSVVEQAHVAYSGQMIGEPQVVSMINNRGSVVEQAHVSYSGQMIGEPQVVTLMNNRTMPPMAHMSPGVIRTMPPRLAPAPQPRGPPPMRAPPVAHRRDDHNLHTLWTCPYCTVPNQMTKSFVEKHIRNCHPEQSVVYIPFKA